MTSRSSFSIKGVPPPPTPARRSALDPGSFSLHAQRKGTKRNAPRRPARDFMPEADPTPGPQRPTGRIGQGPLRGQGSRRREPVPNVAAYSPRRHPLYRRKIVLETPQWGIERPKKRISQKKPGLDPDSNASLSFSQSGGFAGIRKEVCGSSKFPHPSSQGGTGCRSAVEENPAPAPPRARSHALSISDLKGPKGETVFHFDERTVPAKARPLIAFLSAQARPFMSV
jgi:hypothetical protein